VCEGEHLRLTFPPHMTHLLEVIDVSWVMHMAAQRVIPLLE
jgi:hypothetical protein